MARKRVIDPDFWLDEDLAMLSAYARLLYIGLWNLCDDNYATFPNRPEWIKIQVFPYDQNISITELLLELSSSTRILPFKSDDKEYFYIKNFFKHQRIDRPSKPKYPKYSDPSTSTRKEVKEVKLNKVSNGERFSKTKEQLREQWGKRK